MATHLVVSEPFGSRQRGDTITDPAEVAALLAAPESVFVRRVEAPDAPPEQPAQ